MNSSHLHRSLSLALILSFVFSALLVAPAFADCPDGDSLDNTLVCADEYDSDYWFGEEGNDTMTLTDDSNIEESVYGGEGNDTIIVDDGAAVDDSVYGNEGDDTITIGADGYAGGYVAGGEGDDTIVNNGYTGYSFIGSSITGDSLLFVFDDAEGGDDTITVNGYADGNVIGDGIIAFGDASGGDDVILIGTDGDVEGDVIGDAVSSFFGDASGGDDIIVINGEVYGDVYADDSYVSGDETGGNDTVIVNAAAYIEGILDGGDGTDSLVLTFVPQSILNTLNPADDSYYDEDEEISYYWINFESLLEKILASLDEGGEDGSHSVIYLSGNLLGIDEGDGIKVFSNDGVIAFIPYADLAGLTTGGTLTFQQPNSGGWYAVVTDLGVNPDNGGNHLYQVSIYDTGGALQGQFTVAN